MYNSRINSGVPFAALLLLIIAASVSSVSAEHPNAIKPLAQDFTAVYTSPDAEAVRCYSPGLARCPNGRLIATMDLFGPGLEQLPGIKGDLGNRIVQHKAFVSDDHGRTWRHVLDAPLFHARPFVAGKSLYILGHANDLTIIRSDDWGETWSEPAKLTSGQFWHQAPCNVHYDDDNVYLVMERRVNQDIRGWYVGELAPVLMRAPVDADLTKRENWTFATEMVFNQQVDPEQCNYIGIPFYTMAPDRSVPVADHRYMNPIGWLETNVVQFKDPDHIWYDPDGNTFHLWMRAHTGGTGYAAIAKVVEQDDGSMITLLESAPSGKEIVYIPCPGGQMKFHVLYDEKTKLFWLLSTQSTDSMTRPDRMPPKRYDLPNNERRRLQLHFSKNMIDWCFAGLVAVGPADNASRHYASMLIDGDDLHILSRSGDERAHSAHDGNIISFHTISNFRELAY